ncbi:MAG: hypothetical protein ACLR4A_01675 [Christensenellales bacterium]
MKKFASILLSMLMATGAIAAASAETYTGTAQGHRRSFRHPDRGRRQDHGG